MGPGGANETHPAIVEKPAGIKAANPSHGYAPPIRLQSHQQTKPPNGLVRGALLYRAGKQYTVTLRARRHAQAIVSITLLPVLLAGCGVQYRPVVSAINPVGPAGQPTKYAIAVSSPGASLPGLVTYVDESGDSVLSTPFIQVNPSYFAVNTSSGVGYTINAQGSLDDFGIFNPTGVLTSNITQTTLPAASGPVSISAVAPSGGGQDIFIPEAATSKIAVLSGGSSPALLEEIAVGANPVYVVGVNSAPRVYAISQNNGGNGQLAAIEALSASSLSVTATIPVGSAPVYGVMTADARRAFVLNSGSGTVSVVNVTNNALDATTPTITLPNTPSGAAPNPVWADLSTIDTDLVVLNKGDGVHPGTLSIISIPLCNAQTLTNNPNCNANNPVDAVGFGSIVATATVGVNPTMVSVLADGTRAYVINQSSATGPCSTGASAGQGSLSVVNLLSGVVTATICGVATGTASDGYIHGHPNSVIAITGTPTGKVYVTSSDSPDLTVIYTDTDTVQTHITLQGNGLRVLASAQ